MLAFLPSFVHAARVLEGEWTLVLEVEASWRGFGGQRECLVESSCPGDLDAVTIGTSSVKRKEKKRK